MDPAQVISNEFPPLGDAVKVLMVWPRFPASYWSLGDTTQIVPERSLVPPLGLITVAALCPSKWTIRLVDKAFQELRDEDILWADLVMVSAMHVQRDDTLATLERCSRLNRRTIIGGPYASAEPEAVLSLADHVVVGEPDEIFSEIIALIGHVMPGMGGRGVGIGVLRVSPQTKIVLIVEPVPLDALEDLRVRDCDFKSLPAPFSPEELASLIDDCTR